MRTPIVYYGGKLSLINELLPLIPDHKIYTEPFMGGGAVYFAKEPSQSEIINDTNNFVCNFYMALKIHFKALKKKIDGTLYSRATYKVALNMYTVPHLFNDLQKAWAFWVLTNQGFSGIIGSWSYDRGSRKARSFHNKKLRFTKELAQRLEHTQIENNDAVKVIQSRDTKNTFHFIDPPYVGADQGHYKGYTRQDFKELLETLAHIDGKFLMTTYDSELLDVYVKKYGWHQKKLDKPLTASNSKTPKRKRKVEVLTTNYET